MELSIGSVSSALGVEDRVGNMIEIKNILEKIDRTQKCRITNERQEIIYKFTETINNERYGTKYKPITGKAVACKLGHLKDNATLYYFLSQCKDYQNRHGSFSKYFFGALKVKK